MSMENDNSSLPNEDEIFAEIGRSLLGAQFGSVRLSNSEAARAGRSWFQSVLPTIRAHICGNPKIKAQIDGSAAAARNTALVAILDAALSGVFAGVPVTTISLAIAMYGYYKICEGNPGGSKS